MPGSTPAFDSNDLSLEWRESASPSPEVAASLEVPLAKVVHEIKNPLGILLLGTEYLHKKLPASDANAHRVLEDMRNAITRADAIVRGLMELSAAEILEPRLEDLHAVIDGAIKPLHAEFVEKRPSVVRKFAAGVPPLLLDKYHLQKAMSHLLRNAFEAMPAGGTLTVQTLSVPAGSGPDSLDEPTVHIIIRDSGRGVAAPFLRRVFEPFFTTDKTGRKSGLGLTIAQKIILSHRGTISIANGVSGGAQVFVAVGGRRGPLDPSISTQPTGSAHPTHPQTRNAP
jgi:signal transduction histidine kinase